MATRRLSVTDVCSHILVLVAAALHNNEDTPLSSSVDVEGLQYHNFLLSFLVAFSSLCVAGNTMATGTQFDQVAPFLVPPIYNMNMVKTIATGK